MKKAILTVSFGTTHQDTREKNITAVERALAEQFPDWEVRRAFTSRMVIGLLHRRDGIEVDTVEQALERLCHDGFRQVVCQPTHVINGLENDGMIGAVNAWADRFERVAFGAPLLTSTADYERVTRAIRDSFAGSLARRETALVLMGHGTSHHANAAYAALDYWFKAAGAQNIFVGTVEGDPDLGAVVEQVRHFGAKRVVLAPLMLVAGDHAKNDMSGDGEDSWKSVFQREGFLVECAVKGLGEYPEIKKLYVEHARAAIAVCR